MPSRIRPASPVAPAPVDVPDRVGLHLPDWLAPAIATQIARTAIDARHPRRLIQAGEAAVAVGETVWQGEPRAGAPVNA